MLHCRHPFDLHDVFASMIIFVVCFLSAAGGIGGGGVLVPVYVIFKQVSVGSALLCCVVRARCAAGAKRPVAYARGVCNLHSTACTAWVLFEGACAARRC
jgi:hypothetical protein